MHEEAMVRLDRGCPEFCKRNSLDQLAAQLLNKGLADYFKDSAGDMLMSGMNCLTPYLESWKQLRPDLIKSWSELPQQKNDSTDPTVSTTADIPTSTSTPTVDLSMPQDVSSITR